MRKGLENLPDGIRKALWTKAEFEDLRKNMPQDAVVDNAIEPGDGSESTLGEVGSESGDNGSWNAVGEIATSSDDFSNNTDDENCMVCNQISTRAHECKLSNSFAHLTCSFCEVEGYGKPVFCKFCFNVQNISRKQKFS